MSYLDPVLAWLNANPVYQALLIVPLAMGVAVIVDLLGRIVVTSLARKTRSDLDDKLVAILRRPVAISIVLAGVGYAVEGLGLPEDTVYLCRGILLSAVIVYWTIVGMRSASTVLVHMSSVKDDNGLIQVRTMPVFEIGAKVVLVGACLYFLFLAWGIDVSAWLASAGILGIAVGFAAQDTLANLFAGLSVVADAPYKIGDYLVLDSGERGQVTSISFRSTRLVTKQDTEIVLPNAVMASSKIVNLSTGPHVPFRLDIAVGVAYGTDIDRAMAMLEEVGGDLAHTSPRFKPQVRFMTFGASSLDLLLRVWLEDPGRSVDVTHQANVLIYKRFTAEDIEIPYTKHDVYLYPMASKEPGAPQLVVSS